MLSPYEAKTAERFTQLLLTSAFAGLSQPPQPNDLDVYFPMDEVATTFGEKQLEALENAYNIARASRIIMHTFFQNWSQVKKAFRGNEGAVFGAAGAVQFFRNHDPETVRFLQQYGEKTTRWFYSESEGENYGESQNIGRNGGQTRTGMSKSRGLNHYGEDLISPQLVSEGLGSPTQANHQTADQILIYAGLHAPVLAQRQAYFMRPNHGGADNPYAPPTRPDEPAHRQQHQEPWQRPEPETT